MAIFRTTGHVKNGLYVTGFAWSPSYLLVSRTPVLFEAGFYCMGRLYERDIRNALGGVSPRILFLTHVHYDHSGAAAYLKRVFPGLRIAASERSAEIMGRENARRLMASLSEDALGIISGRKGVEGDMLLREPFSAFGIDHVVRDGEIIKVDDDLSVRVIAAPGHTRDLVSYYIPERKVLVATEAVGVMGQTGHIISEFLVDYNAYMASLKRLSLLDVDVLCQGHHFVFTGKDVKDFFARSMATTERFRVHVEELLKAHDGSVQRVVEIIKAEEYDPNPGPKQPEKAYLLNLTARVGHLRDQLKSTQ